MESISYFDLIIASLILFLGLKGIINGFFKEIFGMAGIVGGIFIGSTAGPKFGSWLDEQFFNFQNEAAIAFTGFIVILALFWVVMTFIGTLFTKLSVKSGLGPMDRLFGFVLGSGKIFFIFAVITYALGSINIIKKSLDPMFEKSMLYPFLFATGSVIIQIDPQSIEENLKDQAADHVETLLDDLTQTPNEVQP